jgi:hypothetical protein
VCGETHSNAASQSAVMLPQLVGRLNEVSTHCGGQASKSLTGCVAQQDRHCGWYAALRQSVSHRRLQAYGGSSHSWLYRVGDNKSSSHYSYSCTCSCSDIDERMVERQDGIVGATR